MYLGKSFTPFDLAPGESHSVGWNGVVNEGGFELGHASGAWEFGNDAGEANPADNIGRFRISVPGGLGTLTAKVFVDNKGTYDGDQPGLPGAEVFVTDPDGTPVATGKTNATGWVTFTSLAAQDYRIGVTGWTLRGDDPVSVLTQVMATETATDYLALLPGSGPSPSGSVSASASATASPAQRPAQRPALRRRRTRADRGSDRLDSCPPAPPPLRGRITRQATGSDPAAELRIRYSGLPISGDQVRSRESSGHGGAARH
jgi:hypothetical protein